MRLSYRPDLRTIAAGDRRELARLPQTFREAAEMEDATTEIEPWDTGHDLRGYRCVSPDPVAVVLLIHGFGEHALRHERTMLAWAARGVTTYAYDQRGHGSSPGKPAIVERIDGLVDDTLVLRARVAAERPHLPLFLFGISMGGVVALRSAQRRNAGLRGVVLLAPALAIFENVPRFARTILRGLRTLAPRLAVTPISTAALSRDPEVGKAYAADPRTYHGGVPLCSVMEMYAGGEAAIADAATYTLPTLILQGDADTVIFPIGARRFKEAAIGNSDLTVTVVPGGYHELFKDPGAETLIESTAAWILAHAR